tara:strand:+ start:260 stop:1357 length:1098 start_codon:yes stop_codon:yes gene_type:complete
MLQFLPYALAAYGGYKGYRASKDAGGSGLQALLAGATGAAAGYYGGKGVLSGGSAMNIPGFTTAQQSFTPFTSLGPIQSLGQSIPALNIAQTSDGFGMGDEVARQTYSQQLSGIQAAQKAAAAAGGTGGPGGTPADMNALQKLLFRQRLTKQGDFTGEMEFSPGKVAAAIAAGTYLSGAFEPKPQDVYTPTYNLAVAELQKQRGGFKYIDAVTGEEKVFDQPYIPEKDRNPQFVSGPYELSKSTFHTGGLATIPRFNQGGVNFLPSKVTHDENDSNNYVRAQGYVEDGSGTGDKDKDTMLAQLADGEFVTRADGVLGAGIIAGANPESFKDMREKGASYFYEQQKRYKRVFDLLKGSRDAKAKAN